MKKYQYRNFVTALVVIGFLMNASTLKAQSTEENLFLQANQQYENGSFDSALILYNGILEQELQSAPLYFNIGNTYYKLRNYPMAIYYYEKAKILDPSNAEINQNLYIANMHITDKIEVVPELFFVRWWNNFQNLFSLNLWSVITIIIFALLLISLFLFIISTAKTWRKTGFYGGIVMVILLVCTSVICIQKYRNIQRQDEAIIITPTVTVKSSPTANSVDLFVLHEGSKVKILDQAAGWNKIKIGNGSVGWLLEDSMKSF